MDVVGGNYITELFPWQGFGNLSFYLFSKHHEVIGLMSSFKDFITLYFMCMNDLPAGMYVYHLYVLCMERPEEGIRPLGLEIRIVMSHHWVLGIQPGSPKRASTILKHRANAPATIQFIMHFLSQCSALHGPKLWATVWTNWLWTTKVFESGTR